MSPKADVLPKRNPEIPLSAMKTVNAWKITFRENQPHGSSQIQTAGSQESDTHATTCIS